jgi:hypothetical protein
MTDLEWCDAIVKARRVRDEAILPLFDRVTAPTQGKIRWSKVASVGSILPGGDGFFAAEVESPFSSSEAESPVFSIRAAVTIRIREDKQELWCSVKCDDTNAYFGRLEGCRTETIFQPPEYNQPIADFDFNQIYEWCDKQFTKCAARVHDRLKKGGCL